MHAYFYNMNKSSCIKNFMFLNERIDLSEMGIIFFLNLNYFYQFEIFKLN